jgi:hypothetical protein
MPTDPGYDTNDKKQHFRTDEGIHGANLADISGPAFNSGSHDMSS